MLLKKKVGILEKIIILLACKSNANFTFSEVEIKRLQKLIQSLKIDEVSK